MKNLAPSVSEVITVHIKITLQEFFHWKTEEDPILSNFIARKRNHSVPRYCPGWNSLAHLLKVRAGGKSDKLALLHCRSHHAHQKVQRESTLQQNLLEHWDRWPSRKSCVQVPEQQLSELSWQKCSTGPAFKSSNKRAWVTSLRGHKDTNNYSRRRMTEGTMFSLVVAFLHSKVKLGTALFFSLSLFTHSDSDMKR